MRRGAPNRGGRFFQRATLQGIMHILALAHALIHKGRNVWRNRMCCSGRDGARAMYKLKSYLIIRVCLAFGKFLE